MSGLPTGLVPSFNNVKTCFRVDDSDVPRTHDIDNLKMRCSRLRKNLGVSAKLLSESKGRCWMLTLTYADANGWKPTHIRDCLRHLRQWLWRSFKWRLRYLWVMETQDRKSGPQKGQFAPHYHPVIWVPHQVSQFDLRMDERGWWPHGLTNAVKAIAPVRYVMKYASKFDSVGSFPKGARCYGIGGLDQVGRSIRSWLNLPSFVQGRASIACNWRRSKGGGWQSPSGQWWPSEWALLERGKHSAQLLRVFNHPRIVDACGPFSWSPTFQVPA